MEVLDYVERDLNSCYHDNFIYYLDGKSNYKKLYNLLYHDYGFLDIVLDFEDFHKLKKIFERLPKDENQRKVIKNMIIRDYLNYSILNDIGIKKISYDISISKIGDALFSGNLTKYFESEDLFFSYDIFKSINEKLESLGIPHARMHFLLDNVDDKRLQKNINDLFECPTDVAMMAYTSSDLITYKDTNDQVLNETHFTKIMSEEKIKKILKERRNKK